VNLGIANVNQVVLTSGVLRPATNSSLDLGSTSYYYRNLYATTGTIGGALSVGNGTTQTGLINWPSSGASSGLTWGAGPYSSIVDDGDLRIATDDNMHFYTGLSGSSNGTERLTLSAAGVTCQSPLICNSTASVTGTFTAPSINLPQSSGFTGYTSQLNNNAGFINNANGVTVGGGSFSVNLGRPASAATLDVGGGGNFNGNVQVQTTANYGMLNVGGGQSCLYSTGYQFMAPGTSGTGYSQPRSQIISNMSIYASGRIMGQEVDAFSDSRIKTGVTERSPVDDLGLVSRLRPVEYQYIDWVAKGPGSKTGFIAQDVSEVFPAAVRHVKDFVPDVYCHACVVARDEQQVYLSLPQEKEGIVRTGDRVRLYVDEALKVVETVVGRVAYDGFWVNSDAIPVTDKTVFVWGREVDDFRVLCYEDIFTLNVGATQALKRQVDEQQETIQELLKKVEYLYWSKADIAV